MSLDEMKEVNTSASPYDERMERCELTQTRGG